MKALAIVAALATAMASLPAGARMGAPQEATEEPSLSVVGLDAADHIQGEAMTAALRRAVQRRGYTPGGATATAAEVRLAAGGCDTAEAECVAKGAAMLDADLVMVGSLVQDGDALALELRVVDVREQIVTSSTTYPLLAADLEGEQLDATAERVVATLLGASRPTAAPAPDLATPLSPEAPEAAPTDTRSSKYVWGAYSPRPPWKRAIVGVSLGLTVTGVAFMVIGLPRQKRLRLQINDEAEASQRDGNGDGQTTLGPDGLPTPQSTPNDVPNDEGVDLCKVALHSPMNQPDAVWNKDVAELCRRGRAKAVVATVGSIFASLGVVGLATGITLMFVRRAPGTARQFGISPSLSGLSVHGRF